MKKIGKLLLTISFIFILCSTASAFWMWTPETNKWVNPKYSVKETPREQLEFAVGFYETKDFKKAANEFEKLIKYYPQSREAAESQYYLGRCLEDQKSLYKAFQAYQKVIDKYPFSDRSTEIVDKQFDIGKRMMEGEGESSSFFTVIAGTEYPVVDIFRQIIKNSPYGKHAAPSQYKIGLYYQEKGEYQEARDEFEKVINDYPESEWVKAARYQIALADAQRSSDAPYDQKTTKAAVEEFEDFVAVYPDAELSDKAKEQIGSLRSKEAENSFLIGKYYEKRREYNSAKIYYKEVVKKYKDTPWAKEAQEQLKTLELKENQ